MFFIGGIDDSMTIASAAFADILRSGHPALTFSRSDSNDGDPIPSSRPSSPRSLRRSSPLFLAALALPSALFTSGGTCLECTLTVYLWLILARADLSDDCLSLSDSQAFLRTASSDCVRWNADGRDSSASGDGTLSLDSHLE